MKSVKYFADYAKRIAHNTKSPKHKQKGGLCYIQGFFDNEGCISFEILIDSEQDKLTISKKPSPLYDDTEEVISIYYNNYSEEELAKLILIATNAGCYQYKIMYFNEEVL